MTMTDIEQALDSGRAPWTDFAYKNQQVWVFYDAYPVTEGHLLFVPAMENNEHIIHCYAAAYNMGLEGVAEGHWDGFNVGQNFGSCAGQTVDYPHVHLIPRRSGDMSDPRGGVRHVIPTKGNYKKETECK